MSARGEWVAWASDIPDLTEDEMRFMCLAEAPRLYCCTRRRGHGGRHAAGNGFQIVAVWNQSEGES